MVKLTLKLFVLPLLLCVSGCADLGYYWQSVEGHISLMKAARPIDDWLIDPETPEKLKAKLALTQKIRAFSAEELKLPDNASYKNYADLKRKAVVWNVVAAPALSLKLKTWCFPVAGCVGYRGYFSEAEAKLEAEELKKQNFDVSVYGVPAYSTLGWFDDPVLNTVMRYPDAELARLIFHELAHQVAYIPGDTVFNESFSVAVELEGVDRWLTRDGDSGKRAAFELNGQRKGAFIGLVMKYRDNLRTLYASAASDAEKRRRKAETFAAMKAEYLTLKASWDGYAGYDRFFAQELNNAHLVPVATYSELVPGFRRLLAENGGDLKRFYAAVRELGKLSKAERASRLGAVQSGTAQR